MYETTVQLLISDENQVAKPKPGAGRHKSSERSARVLIQDGCERWRYPNVVQCATAAGRLPHRYV